MPNPNKSISREPAKTTPVTSETQQTSPTTVNAPPAPTPSESVVVVPYEATQRDVDFLRARDYRVATVDEAKQFVEGLTPDHRKSYLAEIAEWRPTLPSGASAELGKTVVPVRVVAGLIHWPANDTLLVAQILASDARFPLAWEFPGGKVDEGENDTQALVRKLKEELDFSVDPKLMRSLTTQLATDPKSGDLFEIHYFVVEYRGGLIRCVPGELAQVRWVERDAISTFEGLLDSDRLAAKVFLSGETN